MAPPKPYTLVAELSYRCPLRCPYCSNPVDIGADRYRDELEGEHWMLVEAETAGAFAKSDSEERPNPMLAFHKAVSAMGTLGRVLSGNRSHHIPL